MFSRNIYIEICDVRKILTIRSLMHYSTQYYKNVLCIRTDNMGDLLMSEPAIRALKETFNCKITALISAGTAEIAQHIDCIDQVIPFQSPWNRENVRPEYVTEIIDIIKARKFDAAIILTVYSQNPLPAALLAFMAGIPVRLAYCRENPYQLLTHWIPDPEPYFTIHHQVARDIKLVKTIGASTSDDQIHLTYAPTEWQRALEKIRAAGCNPEAPWIILHVGVSEDKRMYPVRKWIETSKRLIKGFNLQLLFTGNAAQSELIHKIVKDTGFGAIPLPGVLTMAELIALIDHAPFIISVNTVMVHIAASVNTPVLVLYAMTNPQHTPWKVYCRTLLFHPPKAKRSKNAVVRFVYDRFMKDIPEDATPNNIIKTVFNSFKKFLPQ